ncbi:hypothetical protein HOY82DRAFT_611580 [Tuber indicum]|nr:hypothetical protein HOY82DRAFT_611580 [Tuber indicum]
MNKLPAVEEPTVEDIKSWVPERLLVYIQTKLSNPLNERDAQQLLDAQIDGSVFLAGASDSAFFERAYLSFGSSVKLAGLSGKIIGRNSDNRQSDIFQKLPLDSKVKSDLQELSNRTSWRRIQVFQKCLQLGPEELSDPALETQLPFPFVFDTLPKRFKFGSEGDEHNWVYMGREKFAELLYKLKEVRESNQNSGFWLYGTRGYGKSHLLAALVCYLTARGERVVYIPDCRECVKDPVPYIKAAMLFAWGDDDDQRESIMLLATMEMIYHYFQSVKNVIFVIDQLNALACLKGDSPQQVERKGQVEEWLLRYRTRHKCILSTSANYKAYLQTETSQASELRLHVYGGLTTKEMEYWWKRNSNVILDGDNVRGGYTKDRVEDQTGCIPLFLNGCLVNDGIDLGVDILKKVWKQVQSFVSHTKRTVNRESWDLDFAVDTSRVIFTDLGMHRPSPDTSRP